jgi:hypothetical protein
MIERGQAVPHACGLTQISLICAVAGLPVLDPAAAQNRRISRV